jgi:hypothetical protein
MPAPASLRDAVAHLRPGGEVYVTGCQRLWWSRRSALGSLRQVATTLRELGLLDVRPYWHWPSFERCLEIVPLDEPPAVAHSLSRRGRGFADRLKSWAARLLLRAGLLPRLVPAFGVLARKPGDTRAG